MTVVTSALTLSALSPDELAAHAFIVEQARQRSGGNRWDRTAIAGQLARLGDLEPLDALTAALRAAADTAAATPVAITWEQYRYDLPSCKQPTHLPLCERCGRTQPLCARAQRNTGTDPHPFRSRPARGAA